VKECFCGCGRTISRFPLGLRSMNRRGKQVSDRLAFVREHGFPGDTAERVPGLVDWCNDGDAIVAELAAAVHGDIDPAVVAEEPVRHWQAAGRELESLIKGRRAVEAQQRGESD
jgi:hypothetical protein